jgi:hypothetical protein
MILYVQMDRWTTTSSLRDLRQTPFFWGPSYLWEIWFSHKYDGPVVTPPFSAKSRRNNSCFLQKKSAPPSFFQTRARDNSLFPSRKWSWYLLVVPTLLTKKDHFTSSILFILDRVTCSFFFFSTIDDGRRGRADWQITLFGPPFTYFFLLIIPTKTSN